MQSAFKHLFLGIIKEHLKLNKVIIDFFRTSTTQAICCVDTVLESSYTYVYAAVLRACSRCKSLVTAGFKRSLIKTFALALLINSEAFSAGGQLLNSAFFINPAQLNLINKFEFTGGNLFFNPQLYFAGNAYGQTGSASSNVYDPIPFMFVNYRLTDKWVVGVNLNPSIYGALDWTGNSIAARSSVQTNILYYRAGLQTSYQILPKLSVGFGANAERTALEINYITKDFGFERNKNADYHFVADLGLYYSMNPSTKLFLVYYSHVYSISPGTSTAGNIVNYNYQASNVDASVIYFGLNKKITDWWNMEGKIYFSDWSILHDIYLLNTVEGDIIIPVLWRDVWSFQLTNNYVVTDNLNLFNEFLYETNPISNMRYNKIAFPLSAAIIGTAGFEYKMYDNYYLSLAYSYGTFVPNAQVFKTNEYFGNVSAKINNVVLQGKYKL